MTSVLSFCSLEHSKIAPANSQRQQELDEEKEKVTAMRIYRRKIYETQKRMVGELVEHEPLALFPGLCRPSIWYAKTELTTYAYMV